MAIYHVLKSLLFILLFLLLFFFTTQSFFNFIPDERHVGATIWIATAVCIFTIAASYLGLRAVAKVFVRYVSQNVNYTSTIILKRVIKAKIEIGLVMFYLLYPPVLYNLVQSVIGKDALPFLRQPCAQRNDIFIFPSVCYSRPPLRIYLHPFRSWMLGHHLTITCFSFCAHCRLISAHGLE